MQPPFCQFDLRFIPCCSTGEIYLRDNDVTILLTEQNARQALQISDYGLVLEQGQTRIEEAHGRYKEDLSLFREVFRDDPDRYAGDVARIEASLEELAKKFLPLGILDDTCDGNARVSADWPRP